jgi:hypothetical protein
MIVSGYLVESLQMQSLMVKHVHLLYVERLFLENQDLARRAGRWRSV